MILETKPRKTLTPVLDQRAGRLCRAVASLFLLWLGLTLTSMAAQAAGKGQIDNVTAEAMTTGFNQGMAAFEKSDWKTALAEMEKVITLYEKYPDKEAIAAAKPRMASVYFMVGAAAFNVPDFPKAIADFARFIAQFPSHEKMPHARLALARATYLNGDFAKAAKLFAEMERYPSLREKAMIIQAECLKESGKTKELVVVVEKLLADGIMTTGRAGAALMLAQAWAIMGEYDKLAPLLDQLITHRHMVENVVELNALIVGLGDAQMAKDQYDKAARTYLNVLPPAQVIAFQKQRIDSLRRRIAANKVAAARNPQEKMTILGQNAEFQSVLDQAKELLAGFEKLSDYMPGLMLRSSRCWYGRDKKWEAILVNERLIELYPNAAQEKEAALFSNVLCYADLTRVKSCQQLCEQYLKEFPKGENAGTVAYVQGAVAMQGGDVKGAAILFEKMIDAYPDSSFINQMYLLLGSAHFSLGELDDARHTYERYIEKFPQGSALEEAGYRAAIIPVYQGKYEEAWKMLEAFLKKYPASPYVEEAEYRLMICKYAASLYDQVLTDVARWQRKHSAGSTEPEVLALKGDCLAALLKNKEAVAAYRAAAKSATTDEVLNYALNEASKLLQKLGDMAQLSQMWEDFIGQRPDHFSVVVGVYWICKAKTREGKLAEAKEITVAQLKHSLNHYKNECVEMLLQQLAQLCWKRPRVSTPEPAAVLAAASLTPQPAAALAAASLTPQPAAVPAVVADSVPVLDQDGKPVPPPEAPAPPPLPPWDAMAELEQQIEPLVAIADASGRPRLAYVRMELLKMLKKQEQADELLGEIAKSPPAVLSPQLLALSGEFMQSHKRNAEATVFYNYLKDYFLKSAWLDYAYSGLGAMELAKGNTKKAVDLYTLAADEYAGAKVKESTLGLAMALLEIGRYPEAKKLYERVASTREWRGDATVQAVFYLGMVEERQGRLAEAVAHYQRVFVAYQKYIPWVEKAYIKAAQCFDKLGKRKEAIAHLQEVLRNDKLGLKVKSEARELLQQWGAES
jgi:TolA-binding protein